MKTLTLAAAISLAALTGAYAQTSTNNPPQATTEGNTPAVATPEEQNPTAPVEGANSFTENQAKERIEENGFTNVMELMKDDQGVWRAKATKDGAEQNVSLDYQGNVVAKTAP